MSDDKIKHESFGVLSISRVSSSGAEAFFNSSIKHSHYIELAVYPAYVRRDLHRDWIMNDTPAFVKVRMSNSQFAEAITSMNLGVGTPVTIEAAMTKEYKQMSSPILEDKRLQFDNEFEQQLREIGDKVIVHADRIQTLCLKLSQKSRDEVHKALGLLLQEINSNVPFIKKSFTEQMDKTVLEAKGELEGFFLNKVTSLGVKSLKMQDVFQIENKNNEEQDDSHKPHQP